jgi:hypothetical protein
MTSQQKEAMSRHFMRMAKEPEYKKECTQERNSNFLATDVNLNGMLDLDEWKQFCRK